jgi:hypothetical protein
MWCCWKNVKDIVNLPRIPQRIFLYGISGGLVFSSTISNLIKPPEQTDAGF